jgi:Ig-like domain CHU_C associated
VTSLSDADCTANPGDRTGAAVITINPRPTSVVSGSTTLCDGEVATIQAVLSGIGPWNVTWSDGLVQTTNAPLGSTAVATRLVSTNNPLPDLATNYTYTVTSLSDANCTANPGDRTGAAVITINPRPSAPVSDGDMISCAGVTNPPLSVTVTNGALVDWYDAASGGNLLTNNSTMYVPTNTAVGTHFYYAQAYFTSGCTSTNRTRVALVLQSCTNSLSIVLADTNVVLEWFGNLELQSASGLTNPPPPNWWSNLTIGDPGITNRWTNPASGEEGFFRLYAPTN